MLGIRIHFGQSREEFPTTQQSTAASAVQASEPVLCKSREVSETQRRLFVCHLAESLGQLERQTAEFDHWICSYVLCWVMGQSRFSRSWMFHVFGWPWFTWWRNCGTSGCMANPSVGDQLLKLVFLRVSMFLDRIPIFAGFLTRIFLV